MLVAVGAAAFEAALLEAAAHGRLHVVRRCVDVADLLATSTARLAEVAVVSAQLRGLDTTVVARLRNEGVAVLGMTVEPESADEARLRELGVAAVVDASRIDQLDEVIDELIDDDRDAADASDWSRTEPPTAASMHARTGAVVAVWGPMGAPGRSTLACGIAAAAAELGRRTLLVDADVYGGTIAPMLGMLDESSGLLAAARAANHGELRPPVLVRLAREVNPTLRVLTGLPRADRWVEVGSVLMRRVLEIAATVSDLTVVDTGFNLEVDEELSYDTAAPRRNGATIEALTRADIVIAVGGSDPVSLGRLVRGIHDLRTAVPAVTPLVVVNRARGSLGWSEREVAEMIGRATGLDVTMTLPDEPVVCDRALVTGKTLVECAPESRLVRRMRSLTADLLGIREPVRRRRAGGAR